MGTTWEGCALAIQPSRLGTASARARLLLCISIPSSIASANRFSSCIVRWLLLCIRITVDPATAFVLAWQPYWLQMQMHANTGVDTYETPRHGHIKGVTKAQNECVRFPLTLMQMHKRSPSLKFYSSMKASHFLNQNNYLDLIIYIDIFDVYHQ